MTRLAMRIGLQQRVLASYRVALFDALAAECAGGMSLFAGQPRPDEMIDAGKIPEKAQLFTARNKHLFRGPLYMCWQSGWRRWLSDWQPEALILEANPRYLHVPAMARWMHHRGRPVIGWGLGAPRSARNFSRLRDYTRRNFLSNFDALVTYSRQGAEEYCSMGFEPERVFIAPNAVAPRPAWPLPDRPAVFTNPPIVLFVGRLQTRKRVDLLIRACAAVPADLRPELWIVGNGPEKSRLEALAGETLPSTRFFGGLYGEALAPVFTKADLFVLPGTGGLAVQEAMSYGLPVAVAEADGTQVDLVRPENGWFLPPGNLEALVQILIHALSDPNRLRQMGKNSYHIVSDEINLENMVDIFMSAVTCARRTRDARFSGG